MKHMLLAYFLLCHISCTSSENHNEALPEAEVQINDTLPSRSQRHVIADTAKLERGRVVNIVGGKDLVKYARTLIGIPYKYASAIPSRGFDCSGFITYVFNHFNIEVPRSSINFTYIGQEVNKAQAREGDLILFTGTADSVKTVGHMGIITENTDTLRFIHSTSGRANGVTVTPFNAHYQRRFVKVIRVLAE